MNPSVKADLIIETGIAHGGSLIFSAGMLELNAACSGPQNSEVLGVDVDIRAHNREAIEAHPMSKRISVIQGSSIALEVIEQVKTKASGKQCVMVCLDSNHTHDHVLVELKAYAPLGIGRQLLRGFRHHHRDMPAEMFPDRPWGPGNNPKTAVWEFLKRNDQFVIDKGIEHKLLITVAPDGYLRRVR